MSVFWKSSPLKRSRSPRTLASAYEKQSPKFKPWDVTSLPKLAERSPRRVSLFDIDIDNFDFSHAEKQVEISKTIGPESRFNDDRSLNEGGG